jgi:hypothetical protein
MNLVGDAMVMTMQTEYTRLKAQKDAICAEDAQRIASEICSTFDVSVPRGVRFANSIEQTIAIIIQQAGKR